MLFLCAVKNRSALFLLLSANAISGFAQGLSMIAIPWYYINVLNKASTYGLLFAGITILTLFWSLYAGTLVDRFPRKNIFLSITGSGALITGTIALIGFQQGQVPEFFIALAFAANVFIFNIHYPTLYAFGQEVTEKKHYGRMNSMFEVQGQSTTMLAGAIGTIILVGSEAPGSLLQGVLPFEIPKWELQHILLLDSVTYMIATLLILKIRHTSIEHLEHEGGKLIDRFRSGFSFLKKNIALLAFGIASYAVFVVIIVEGFFLISLYVESHLGRDASVYALGEVAYSFGAISSGLFIRWVFRHTNYIKGVVILMLITALGFFIAAGTQTVWIFVTYSILIGITNSGIRIMRITYLFENVPNNMIGRVGSIFNSVNILERALFLLLFSTPFFVQGNNIIWAFAICGVFVAISIIPIGIFYRKLVSGK